MHLGIKIEQPASTVRLDDIVLNKKYRTLKAKENAAVKLAAEIIADVYFEGQSKLKIKREKGNIVALLDGSAALIPQDEGDIYNTIVIRMPPNLDKYLSGATIRFDYSARPSFSGDEYNYPTEAGDIFVSSESEF